MRVLIIEDEMRLAKNIAQVFRESGNFAVDISTDELCCGHIYGRCRRAPHGQDQSV
jgi:DNA-binding response OmpR family regulator